MGTTNANMTLLTSAQAQKEVTANDALTVLDAELGANSVSLSNGTNNLTEAQARCRLLILTGALTAPATVVIPATILQVVRVINLTTGNKTVTVQHSGQAGIPIPFNGSWDVWPTMALSGGSGAGNRRATSRAVKSVAGSANVTLSDTETQNRILEFTGALTGNITVFFQAVVDEWIVYNGTTGAFTLTIALSGTGGASFTVGQGKRCIVYADATNMLRVTPDT